jgi:hypothetical protein
MSWLTMLPLLMSKRSCSATSRNSAPADQTPSS